MSKSEIKEYKEKFPFSERASKSASMLNETEGKYPVILLKSKSSKYFLPAHRFIIDGNMTVGGFICAVRKYLWLKPTEGLYIYLDDNLPMLNSKISDLYSVSKDEDGFLYMIYTHQEDKGAMKEYY